MEYFLKILELVVTPTAIVAAITYIMRGYLDNTFKQKQFEFETKYSSLHTKRAEVIAELYSLVTETEILVSSLVSPMQLSGGKPLKDKINDSVATYNKLANFYAKHVIYFPESVCKTMDDALVTMKKSLIDFDIAHTHGMHGDKEYTADDTGLWVSAWKNMDEKWGPIRKQLEKEFRGLLGVS